MALRRQNKNLQTSFSGCLQVFYVSQSGNLRFRHAKHRFPLRKTYVSREENLNTYSPYAY